MDLLYISLILFSLFTFHYVYFIGSIYAGLKKLVNSKSVNNESNDQKQCKKFIVSVVIPFRNEEDVILRNLKSLENVNYPENLFEVIYIDDNSDDNSFNLLKEKISRANFKVVKLPTAELSKANKKQAVEYGISLAKGEIIFASDADCTYNIWWINSMLNSFDEQTGFVAGPVDFETSNSILSYIQQLEHAGLILTGAGLIGIKNPIICSGANIAFRKKLFEELSGYSGYLNLASGDDSFLMTNVFYDSNFKVDFCYDKNAMVLTRANENINEFLNQRKRWAGKAFFYKNKRILVHIVLLSLFLISLPLQFILGFLTDPIFIYSFLLAFIIKFVVEFLVMQFGSKTLFDSKIMKWFLITELIHIPYTVVTVLLSVFSKFVWKGRSIKR